MAADLDELKQRHIAAMDNLIAAASGIERTAAEEDIARMKRQAALNVYEDALNNVNKTMLALIDAVKKGTRR